MSRGRHRHSDPLHKLLPPSLIAGLASALALGTLVTGDVTILRVLAVLTAAFACGGAVLLRRWDRAAGRIVADLHSSRRRDEWRTDEHSAELETDLEESRAIRGRLENKLRTKRMELQGLRSEHAELLRRYATAESGRARAMERRWRAGSKAAQETAARRVDAAAYERAAQALHDLSRNAARQQARHTVEEARRRDVADTGESRGRHAQDNPALPAASPTGRPVREHRLMPAAAAVVPYTKPRREKSNGNRALGGFDFFGLQKATEAGDMADVIGDEVEREVVDLTEHDETERLDVSGLRSAHTS